MTGCQAHSGFLHAGHRHVCLPPSILSHACSCAPHGCSQTRGQQGFHTQPPPHPIVRVCSPEPDSSLLPLLPLLLLPTCLPSPLPPRMQAYLVYSPGFSSDLASSDPPTLHLWCRHHCVHLVESPEVAPSTNTGPPASLEGKSFERRHEPWCPILGNLVPSRISSIPWPECGGGWSGPEGCKVLLS